MKTSTPEAASSAAATASPSPAAKPPLKQSPSTNGRPLTPQAKSGVHVALLTGGFDRPYAFGLSMALAEKGIQLDVVGSDAVDSPEMHATKGLRFLNLQRDWKENVSTIRKVGRVLRFYVELLWYTVSGSPKVLHILWNNKLPLLDRTFLMVFYKLCGKKIAFTAHNVNAGERDGNDSLLNRLTLRSQYQLVDHIFVHTDKMRKALIADFGVAESAVTTIPFGINNSVRDTGLKPSEAKRRLGIGEGERAILFFGAIRPYKGLETLVTAFKKVLAERKDYRLIVAGEPKKESADYVKQILEETSEVEPGRVSQRIEFIPDDETELYFKAADVLVLPYTHVYQSGVLFLAYSFGLPVIATDVGSFREDIIEGKTGFVCQPRDPDDLAKSIETYFASDLYRSLDERRAEIRAYGTAKHSWDVVGDKTRDVYRELLGKGPR